PDRLLPLLVGKLHDGVATRTLVAAAALANARAFGGENYDGYHAFMAMIPALEMSNRLTGPTAAVPVLKVLHRNARFLQAAGATQRDAMSVVSSGDAQPADVTAAIASGRQEAGEKALTAAAAASPQRAYAALHETICDDPEVHRVVLAWRAYDSIRLAGEENAAVLLRQCVHYGVKREESRVRDGKATPELRILMPQLLQRYGLERGCTPRRRLDDAGVESLARTLY